MGPSHQIQGFTVFLCSLSWHKSEICCSKHLIQTEISQLLPWDFLQTLIIHEETLWWVGLQWNLIHTSMPPWRYILKTGDPFTFLLLPSLVQFLQFNHDDNNYHKIFILHLSKQEILGEGTNARRPHLMWVKTGTQNTTHNINESLQVNGIKAIKRKRQKK